MPTWDELYSEVRRLRSNAKGAHRDLSILKDIIEDSVFCGLPIPYDTVDSVVRNVILVLDEEKVVSR